MRRAAKVAAIIVAFAVGCTAPQPNPQVSTPEPTPSAIQFDPQWMGLVGNQPQGWEELNRHVNGDFQQFSLRPADDTEYRFGCNGCAPWTVDLTAYAAGAFDPTEARTGRPVIVNTDGDGFFAEDPARHTATLTWEYAEDAWATVTGLTSATRELDRMVELAHALRPSERTPIRLPLSLANVPSVMPLAEITVNKGGYGTTVRFAPCGSTVNGSAGHCVRDTETLNVHIWPVDGYSGYISEEAAAPMTIGGKGGLFDDALTWGGDHAAVQVAPGMLVVFDCGGPGPYRVGTPPEPPTGLKDILARVSWAPEPENEATWSTVGDWAK